MKASFPQNMVMHGSDSIRANAPGLDERGVKTGALVAFGEIVALFDVSPLGTG